MAKAGKRMTRNQAIGKVRAFFQGQARPVAIPDPVPYDGPQCATCVHYRTHTRPEPSGDNVRHLCWQGENENPVPTRPDAGCVDHTPA